MLQYTNVIMGNLKCLCDICVRGSWFVAKVLQFVLYFGVL